MLYKMLSCPSVVHRTVRAAAAHFHAATASAKVSRFAMPALSSAMSKGGIVRWEKKEGESFAAGDLLLQVKTDKAQIDVNAPEDDILVKILTPEGSQNVPVNAEIAIIAEKGDDISSIVPDSAREITESRVSNHVLVDTNDSPSKVTGSYVGVGVDFTLTEGSCHQEFCKVDKTLICKGFWDDIDKVGRIHLPRRFGKTFNLDIMRMFFSSSLESTSMSYIPDNVIGADDIPKLDTSQLYQKKREWLFRDSALKREDPDFFEKHFYKHPVLFLSFADCKSPTLSGFIRQLCYAMIRAFNNWISDVEESNAEFSAGAVRAKKKLDNLIKCYTSNCDPKFFGGNTGLPQTIFEALSEVIYRHTGRPYILLVDEYDVPFITAYQSEWPEDQQKEARTILSGLFGTMIKGNSFLVKGLMVGVFPIPLGGISSGANNYRDVIMVPLDGENYSNFAGLGSPRHKRSGRDVLVDSFGFNHNEVRAMAERSLANHVSLRDHIDDVMCTIKQWYSGYQIGRFGEKYNPWAVCYYLNELARSVRPRSSLSNEDILSIIKSCAQNYWDKTGSSETIEKQMEMDPSEFYEVANTLLQEYKEHTNPGIVTSRSGKTVVHMPSEEFTISSMSPEYFKQSAFLNLMLSAGYLTARSPTTVGIPNGELQRMWESILRRVLLRGVSIGQGGALKSKVLNEFYKGKADCFHTLVETAVKNISERTDKYGEMEYAHVAVSAITCMERTGIYTHTDQPDISDVDITMSRGPAAGTGYVDWVMLLHSTKNVRGAFAMIVKLRHIPNEEIHNEELGKAKAGEGIDQIDEERYGALTENCVECIHIGMAVGLNTVHMASRLFKRDNAKSKWAPTDSLV